MKIYVKLLIALAAISAGVVCYAGALPAAEQEAGVSGDNYRDDHDCGSWCRYHRYYDGKKMQFRFSAGVSSFIVMDNFDPHPGYDDFLQGYYRDNHGTIKSAGSYGIGFQYNLTRTFSIGVDASVDMFWSDIYDTISSKNVGRATGTAFTFMPQIRLNYLNRPMCRLYSAAGIGLIACYGDYPDTWTYYDEIYNSFDGSVELAWQVSVLGCEIGQTVFGFAELGIGYLYTAARVGIGYRF